MAKSIKGVTHILSKTEENLLDFIFGAIQVGIFFTLCFLLVGCFA